jgi:hypothetical protein
MKRIRNLAVFFFLIAPTFACTVITGTARVEVDPNFVTFTITLSENDVRGIIESAVVASNPPLLANPTVDLRNGDILVTGTYQPPDGSSAIPGEMTLKMEVANEQLAVTVTALNVAGQPVPQTSIDEFNRQLAQGIARTAVQSNTNAKLSGITITDDAMTLSIRTPR